MRESKPILSEREELFAREYLVDLNITQAAIRAKYAPASAYNEGHVTLKKPEVQAYIRQLKEERNVRLEVRADAVLREIGLLASSSVLHYAVDENGELLIKPGAPEGADKAVSSYKWKRRTIPQKDGEPIVEVEGEIKLWDKNAALDKLMRHMGLDGALTIKTVCEVIGTTLGAGVADQVRGILLEAVKQQGAKRVT